MKRNYKILEGGNQPLPQLSDVEIDKLYKVYSEMDGKHKKFKGTKREYCATLAGMIDKFLEQGKGPLKGSGRHKTMLRRGIKQKETDKTSLSTITTNEIATFNGHKKTSLEKLTNLRSGLEQQQIILRQINDFKFYILNL